jgi:hypothetical protein
MRLPQIVAGVSFGTSASQRAGTVSAGTATLARGIRLYAQGQADFNALVETLKAELIAGGELGEAKGFPADAQRAARQRVAFTDYVEEKVLSQSEEGIRSVGAFLGGAHAVSSLAELIEVLGGIGLDIWREYRAADQEQRRQIPEQLDALKWRSFVTGNSATYFRSRARRGEYLPSSTTPTGAPNAIDLQTRPAQPYPMAGTDRACRAQRVERHRILSARVGEYRQLLPARAAIADWLSAPAPPRVHAAAP